MVTLRRHIQPTNLLVFSGMIFLAIGFYGILQTQAHGFCGPFETLGRYHVDAMNFQRIAISNSCQMFITPTYTVLAPGGVLALLFGGGAKMVQLVTQPTA